MDMYMRGYTYTKILINYFLVMAEEEKQLRNFPSYVLWISSP